jgi:REP-associated tyrosine transposase
MVFHVLNRSAKRARLFKAADDYRAFEQVLASALERGDVALFAYCVMPNHWHLLLSPTDDRSLSRFMHWLTTTHARRWQIVHGADGQGAVYQGRFKAVPVSSDRHFLWVCRYVERNALRASLVDRAEDWNWSSISGGEAPRVKLSEWPVARPADWIGLVNKPQTSAEVEAFRNAIKTSEPFGDTEWKETVLGRRARRTGRPRRQSRVSVLEK